MRRAHRDVPGGRFRAPGGGHHGVRCGGRWVSPRPTISELNKRAYVHIAMVELPLPQGGHYPYVYVDDIYLRRNWGGEYGNVAVFGGDLAVN